MLVEEIGKAPFIRLLIPLAGGIILGREGCVAAWNVWILAGCSAGLLSASFLCTRAGSALLMAAFLLMGMALGRPTQAPAVPQGMFSARVCGELVPSGGGQRTLIDRIHYLDDGRWTPVRGKASVLVAGQVSRWPVHLHPGCGIFFRGRLSPYLPPMNPAQFDFGAFQRGRGILYQGYIDPGSWSPSGRELPVGLKIRSLLLRRELIEKMEPFIAGREERDILNALLLGYRDGMDPLLRENFARSGTLHVLAVSGLHVGILYLLPALLLKRLRPYAAAGICGCILVFSGLWMYAFLTGLSSSVVRAVTMCSIHGVALMSGRKVSSAHVISLAAFIMVLARPASMFEAGFLLSFAAVTGILLLYPGFLALMPLPHRAGRWISGMVSVSLAAQVATLPLTVYYFHQAAPAAALANLLVIPLVTLILYAGSLFLLLSGIQAAAGPLALLLERLASFLEWFTRSLAGLPGSSIGGLSLVPSQVVLLYAAGACALLYLRLRTPRSMFLFLSAGILLLSVTLIREARTRVHQGAYVFSLHRETAILFVRGRHSDLYGGCTSDEADRGSGKRHPFENLPYGTEAFFYLHKLHPPRMFPLDDPGHCGSSPDPDRGRITWHRHIRSPAMEAVYIVFDGHRMLVVSEWDEGLCAGLPPLDADILVLCNNPAINVTRMAERFPGSLIVADGSNHPAYAEKIGSACRAAGIPFHSTGAGGCFIY